MDTDRDSGGQFSGEEIAQRRDAIVRVMASAPPQARAAKRLAKPRGRATATAFDRKEASSDASSKPCSAPT